MTNDVENSWPRLERGEIGGHSNQRHNVPDCAALHPGYTCQLRIWPLTQGSAVGIMGFDQPAMRRGTAGSGAGEWRDVWLPSSVLTWPVIRG